MIHLYGFEAHTGGERGRFYRIKRNDLDGSLSMSYEYSQGMCKSS